MKLGQMILAADIHGHNVPSYRLGLFRRQLREITNQALTNSVTHVCILGDLIHSRYKPPGQVLLAIQTELEYAASKGVTWMLLPGNHDIPSKVETVSVLEVFRRSAYVIDKPEMIGLDNGNVLCFAPWRPMAELKSDIAGMANYVQSKKHPAVLFTHTALKEGKVSRSNYQVADYEMTVNDLWPEVFRMVLMGDYHAKQYLMKHVLYLGSIVEHSCKDHDAGGVYLFDFRTPEPLLTPLEFIEHQPRHLYWDLRGARTEQDLTIPGYNPIDYNRIEVPADLEDYAKILWPESDIRGVVTRKQAERHSRLGSTNVHNPSEVLDTFIRIQGWAEDRKMVSMGQALLQKAVTDG